MFYCLTLDTQSEHQCRQMSVCLKQAWGESIMTLLKMDTQRDETLREVGDRDWKNYEDDYDG